MAIDHLKNVPLDWVEENAEKLKEIHEKIKDLFWVGWIAGHVWRAGTKKPAGKDRNVDWKRPTFAQTVERQAMFEGVHKTAKAPMPTRTIQK